MHNRSSAHDCSADPAATQPLYHTFASLPIQPPRRLQKAITFVQPALTNGTVLDLVLTLESISGYASMAIVRSDAGGAAYKRPNVVSRSGVERANLHGSQYPGGTKFTVAVTADTAAATYELQIEAYPAEMQVADGDDKVRLCRAA